MQPNQSRTATGERKAVRVLKRGIKWGRTQKEFAANVAAYKKAVEVMTGVPARLRIPAYEVEGALERILSILDRDFANRPDDDAKKIRDLKMIAHYALHMIRQDGKSAAGRSL